MKLSWCLAWADPELESQHHRNTGLVAHAIISALGEWRPEDPLEFKIILGSEFAASPGLNETLSKTKQQKTPQKPNPSFLAVYLRRLKESGPVSSSKDMS